MTAITPLAGAALSALGNQVTIGYSGDNNYEASDGVTIAVPARQSVLTLQPRPRDSGAPTVEIASPASGARYALGQSVVASYSCNDPEDRSAVTTCEGPVASGSALDTASAGSFTFTVNTADGIGNEGTKSVTYTVAGTAAASAAGSPPPPPPPAAGTTGSSTAGAPPPPAVPPAAPSAVETAAPAIVPASRAAQESSPAAAEPSAPSAPSTAKASDPAGAGEAAGKPPAPAEEVNTSPVSQELKPYDPRSEPEKTFGILAAGLTLLTLAVGGGGLARGGGVAKPASSGSAKAGGGSSRPGFSGLSSYQGVEVRHLAAGFGAVALGDRSRTWAWPATSRVDAVATTLPVVVARRSPLLGRMLADSAYLRAIFGSASLLLPLVGLGLGIAAVGSTGGEALPPSVALTAAIAVIGVIDAASGLVAMLTFLAGVTLMGGLNTGDDLRLMLGLGALWAVVPVLAGVTRPLRRAPGRGAVGFWERGADFIVVSLIGAWTVQRIVLALPGLAGVELPIDEYADQIALLVLAALVLRLALETLASHLYPRRLDSTAAEAFPNPGKLTLIGSAIGRSAIYAFLAYVLIGNVWQLWASTGLFLLTQLIWVYPERFPNSPRLYRLIPKGITQFAVFLFAYTVAWIAMSRWLLDDTSEEFFPNVLVGFGLVGLLLPMPLLFGRSGEARPIGWGKRFLGLGVLVLAVLQVLGYVLV